MMATCGYGLPYRFLLDSVGFALAFMDATCYIGRHTS